MSSPGKTTTGDKPQQVVHGTTPKSPKRLARIAGVIYLLVAVFGGFAQGFLERKMYVAGDAAATTENLVANEGLVRMGVVSDLINEVLLVLLGGFITIPCIIAEVWIAGYLLIVGVNTTKSGQAEPSLVGTLAAEEASASPVARK